MPTAANTEIASQFHFVCPECDFTDAELEPTEIYQGNCEVCSQENRSVRLKCWLVEEDSHLPQTLAPALWTAFPRRRKGRMELNSTRFG